MGRTKQTKSKKPSATTRTYYTMSRKNFTAAKRRVGLTVTSKNVLSEIDQTTDSILKKKQFLAQLRTSANNRVQCTAADSRAVFAKMKGVPQVL